MESYKFKPGQTLGVIRDTLVGDLIAIGESLESPNHGIHFTHIAPVVSYKDQTEVNEMLSEGDTMTDPKQYDNVKYVVFEPAIWWTPGQLEAINKKAAEQHERGTKYDWVTTCVGFPLKFIQIVFRFKSPFWMSQTTDKRMECAEKAAILFNTGWLAKSKDIPYKKPGEVDPDNYVCSGYQKVVYKSF